ncbi:Lipase 3 [Orchesella cincta]|uniref:Lipase 3 n=1 Tax=Orchesella cincta TaxID=48709 RepID=A0A1D2N3Q7_ORCCI|nr:Lipase 3 [Orchesella cincta]
MRLQNIHLLVARIMHTGQASNVDHSDITKIVPTVVCNTNIGHRIIVVNIAVMRKVSKSYPKSACATDLGTLLQQISRVWTRTLGEVLGFASLVLRSSNPPSTVDLIRRHNYPAETHYTRTGDNVVLEIHRIPHGPLLELFRLNRRTPVVLMHGIGQSSSDWLLNTPIKDSLAFMLSNEGYDVWIGNLRGNLNKNSGLGQMSWNYSFHEMGVYDVPAVLKYVTEYTGFRNVHYIGFSMGSTAMLTALSKQPNLNSMTRTGIILGPSIFQDNYLNGWLKLIVPLGRVAEVLQDRFGSIPLLHPFAARMLHRILPIMCHPRIDLIGVCLAVGNLLFGYDRGQITKDKLAVITQVSPTPISSKLLLHYIQELGSGRFCEYDYGTDKNLQMYNTTKPPDYNLTNVAAPIAVMFGQEDVLAHRLDALTLVNKLPNVVDFYQVPYQHFTHLDFCYAEDVRTLVYNRVLEILRRYD